ncbi:glycosyltransferase [Nitrospira sp. BLG_1]|uniref:glycosyltransferase n=1 Tax=Nitrospira sp. BLG_1 TaxID=3395883 RepID=UPI0039BC733B
MIADHMLVRANPEGNTAQLAGRPKLLFIACYFPPVQAIGAVRGGNIERYLGSLGWEVTVVTPDPSLWRNVDDIEKLLTELDRGSLKRILTGHRWRFLVPNHLKCWDQNVGWVAGGICRSIARHLGIDRHIGWVKEAERACSHLCPKDVDIILASGSPFVSFRLAKTLSDRLRRPYVLDYRDPWTQSRFVGRPPRLKSVREEAGLLKDCAAVTIVSPSWAEDLDQRYGVGEKVHVVTNGYDSDEVATVRPYDFGHCAFVFTGNFYPPKISLAPFLAALKLLKESQNEMGNEWYFHYYGAQEDYVRQQAAHYGLTDRIVLHGRVPRREALAAVKGANLALGISSIYEQSQLIDKGTIPGKIFEAIGLGTPVLLITPLGSDATALLTPTGLVKSFTGSDTQGMVSFLQEVVGGRASQPKNIESCSWTTLSKNLDVILRGCLTFTTGHHHFLRDGAGSEPK